MIYRTVQQMTQMLRNLSAILDKGVAFAQANEESPDALIQRQLASDMYSFTRQIQSATDTAKFTAARLSGKTAPSWPDDEETAEALKARLEKAIAYLETYTEGDFTGAVERHVTMTFAPGVYVLGDDYLHEFALPNFYFHVTTAYGILRAAGVEIGKRDFIGHMSFKPIEEG